MTNYEQKEKSGKKESERKIRRVSNKEKKGSRLG